MNLARKIKLAAMYLAKEAGPAAKTIVDKALEVTTKLPIPSAGVSIQAPPIKNLAEGAMAKATQGAKSINIRPPSAMAVAPPKPPSVASSPSGDMKLRSGGNSKNSIV